MPTTGLWHWLPTLIVPICWGLFALVWSAGAVYNSRRAPAVRKRSASALPSLIGIAAVLMLGWIVPTRIWHPITVESRWLMVLGVAVLIGSTGFTLWARAVLGTMWTSSAVVKNDHVLHTSGPYGITRHPIYTGILGMLGGTALIEGLGRWIAFFLLGALLVGLKIRAEEQLLDRTLGEAYSQYRRRVPQLVPGLHVIRR